MMPQPLDKAAAAGLSGEAGDCCSCNGRLVPSLADQGTVFKPVMKANMLQNQHQNVMGRLIVVLQAQMQRQQQQQQVSNMGEWTLLLVLPHVSFFLP